MPDLNSSYQPLLGRLTAGSGLAGNSPGIPVGRTWFPLSATQDVYPTQYRFSTGMTVQFASGTIMIEVLL